MGNYATNEDVYVIFGKRLANADIPAFSGTSIPTDVTVDDWIDFYEAQVDSQLQNPECAHETPITESGAVSRLKGLVVRAAAVDVWYAVWPSDELPENMRKWHDDFNNALKQMANCEFFLEDTAAATSFFVVYPTVPTDG